MKFSVFLANGEISRVDSPMIQDERELKRQRRKQSNRESARRSRLRKQVFVCAFQAILDRIIFCSAFN